MLHVLESISVHPLLFWTVSFLVLRCIDWLVKQWKCTDKHALFIMRLRFIFG